VTRCFRDIFRLEASVESQPYSRSKLNFKIRQLGPQHIKQTAQAKTAQATKQTSGCPTMFQNLRKTCPHPSVSVANDEPKPGPCTTRQIGRNKERRRLSAALKFPILVPFGNTSSNLSRFCMHHTGFKTKAVAKIDPTCNMHA
jgi:hypothetical protein